MKQLLTLLTAAIISLSATAQTINLKFNGANQNRNYQVVLDGTSYYSNSNIDPGNSNASVTKNVTLSNQQPGSHSLEVYRMRNNTGTYSTGTNTSTNGRAVYSKTFELREGYDMDIRINGAGQVTFSERRIKNRANRGRSMQAMSDVNFNQLLQSVNNSRTQPLKLTAVRDAFANTSNYFTTSQVRQLLVLINTEANRFSLAKAAYPRVTDRANFTMLYDVFRRVSSRDEMTAFIRNNPNINGSYTGTGSTNSGPYGGINNNTYRTPVTDYQFTELYQNINNQYNQSSKYDAVRNAFNTNANYYSSVQIRQLLSLISTESDRLMLAKLSYAEVSDPANFSTIYDLFYNQSYRNELNNYVVQIGGIGTNVSTSTRVAMTDDTFAQVLQQARNHIFPWDVVRDVKAAFNNTDYYFSTLQTRQLLTLVTSQTERLDAAKLAWARVTDPANFSSLYDLFTTQAAKDELNSYTTSHPL